MAQHFEQFFFNTNNYSEITLTIINIYYIGYVLCTFKYVDAYMKTAQNRQIASQVSWMIRTFATSFRIFFQAQVSNLNVDFHDKNLEHWRNTIFLHSFLLELVTLCRPPLNRIYQNIMSLMTITLRTPPGQARPGRTVYLLSIHFDGVQVSTEGDSRLRSG